MSKHAASESRASSKAQDSTADTCVDVRTSKGSPPLLNDVPSHRRIAILWKGISAYVPVFQAAPTWSERFGLAPKKTGQAKQIQVLYNVRGVVQPTEVLGLMGPSGSGKTSLISVLGGRKPPAMTVKGDVSFNGVPLSRMLQSSMGFVLQDDILFDTLTVFETLYFAARLRLPHDMPLTEKKERVSAVVTALGLDKCKNTLVGGPMRRGVSGGERKRVSVGHELLISPSIIILDEPTSGLDSTTAMSLIQTLRALARDGRTIITTIHQPSSRLFQQLDRLMLMSNGRVMYSGLGREIGEWFAHFDCKVPYGWNIADYILDLANGEFQDSKPVMGVMGKERKSKLIERCETFLKECEDGFHGVKDLTILHNLGDRPEDRQCRGSERSGSGATSVSRRLRSYPPSKRRLPPPIEKLGAKFMEQLVVLTIRSWRIRRFESLGLQRLINFALTGFIVGMMWLQRGDDTSLFGATDVAALLFFEILFLSPAMMFGALFTFPREMKLLLKERSSGMYHLAAYYIARTTAMLPLDLLYPAIFSLLVYYLGGLRPQFQWFLAHLLAVMLSSLVSQSIGLLIGAAVPQFDKAQTIATVWIITFMLLGGFWLKQVPKFLRWLKFLSFQYWSYSLLAKIEFNGRVIVDCGLMDSDPSNDIPDRADCPPVADVASAINLPRAVTETVWIDVGALFLMMVVMRYSVYVVLKRKTRT